MKIGVAIPTYSSDLKYLDRCLKSIDNQTLKPVLVAISASSCSELKLNTYSFPIVYVTTKERNNAATNRNIAANLLIKTNEDINIISFFDSDDEMYPTRLEYIAKGIKNSDFLLHNFVHLKSSKDKAEQKYRDYISFENAIVPHSNRVGCLTNKEPKQFAHGHVSVTLKVWLNEKFNESKEFNLKEDSEYCKRLCVKGYKGAYLQAQVSIYHNYT